MQYNEKTALLAQLSQALMEEAQGAINPPPEAGYNIRTQYGIERGIGQRLQHVGAGLVALDTIGRALR